MKNLNASFGTLLQEHVQERCRAQNQIPQSPFALDPCGKMQLCSAGILASGISYAKGGKLAVREFEERLASNDAKKVIINEFVESGLSESFCRLVMITNDRTNELRRGTVLRVSMAFLIKIKTHMLKRSLR